MLILIAHVAGHGFADLQRAGGIGVFKGVGFIRPFAFGMYRRDAQLAVVSVNDGDNQLDCIAVICNARGGAGLFYESVLINADAVILRQRDGNSAGRSGVGSGSFLKTRAGDRSQCGSGLRVPVYDPPAAALLNGKCFGRAAACADELIVLPNGDRRHVGVDGIIGGWIISLRVCGKRGHVYADQKH